MPISAGPRKKFKLFFANSGLVTMASSIKSWILFFFFLILELNQKQKKKSNIFRWSDGKINYHLLMKMLESYEEKIKDTVERKIFTLPPIAH